MTYSKNIDDLLGPREGRYFGSGYLGADQTLRDLQVVPSLEGFAFACQGKVTFSSVWSRKADEAQKPHLSTIDVIELTHICLTARSEHALSKSEIAGAAVEKIDIIAGTAPVEDGLEDIEIAGDASHDGGTDTVQVLIAIANMKVIVTLRGGRSGAPMRISAAKLPVSVSEVTTSSQPAVASGTVSSLHPKRDELWPISGSFAAILQLGQVLLYELDGVEREQSNTLWMKRTSIELLPGTTVAYGQQPSRVWLENERRYTKDDGDWRRAEICGLLANTKIVCSVTHKLLGSEREKR